MSKRRRQLSKLKRKTTTLLRRRRRKKKRKKMIKVWRFFFSFGERAISQEHDVFFIATEVEESTEKVVADKTEAEEKVQANNDADATPKPVEAGDAQTADSAADNDNTADGASSPVKRKADDEPEEASPEKKSKAASEDVAADKAD
jgi:hypothetical protein